MLVQLNRMCGILSFLAATASAISAQGFYYDFSNDPTYLYGDTEAFPAYGQSCNWATAWSNFGGYYASGYETYPSYVDLAQSLAYTDGVDYTWTFEVDVTYVDGSGYCEGWSDQVQKILSLRTTYYQAPTIVGDDGVTFHCSYAGLACTSGSPTCDSRNQNPPIVFLWPDYCPSIMKAGYLVSNGTCRVGLGFDATGQTPRICT